VRLVVAEEPWERIRLLEFVIIVKSGGGGKATSKNTSTACESLPLYPVKFMPKAPVAAEAGTNTVKVELPVPVSRETEFGFTAIVALTVDGMVAFRFTLPAKP
jgi:hypothetical protein